MRFACKIALCVVAVTLIASPVWATLLSPTVSSEAYWTNSVGGWYGVNLGPTVYPNNLVLNGAATLQSVTTSETYPANLNNITGINNGLAYTDSVANDSSQGINMVFYQPANGLSGDWTLTFTLNTSVNTLGYNITQILSLSAYATYGAYSQQRYDVYTAPVGSSNFTELGTGGTNGSPLGASGEENLLTYQAASNPGVTPIATGVGAVQFVIHYGTDNVNTTVGCYREIDVIGTATATPEPGTLALLAAGLAGLLCYAWRKRR